MHTLGPQNTESREPETKNTGEKSQNKNELILHNNLINLRWKLITNMIKEFYPLESIFSNNLINAGWNIITDMIQKFEPLIQDN